MKASDIADMYYKEKRDKELQEHRRQRSMGP